jgi:cytochrome c556
MKTATIAAAMLAAITIPAIAAQDPVAVRKALMQNVGAAAAVTGGVMKGELDYSPVVGKAAIAAIAASAAAYGDFFPEGSGADERSEAHPRIWEDRPAFEAELAKLQTAIAAAVEVAGRDGPPDAATFTDAMEPVLGTCRSCHESFRTRN